MELFDNFLYNFLTLYWFQHVRTVLRFFLWQNHQGEFAKVKKRGKRYNRVSRAKIFDESSEKTEDYGGGSHWLLGASDPWIERCEVCLRETR